MTTATHYSSLGLLPTAAPEVIRATYKALALVFHPDKTLHLAPQERASHAAKFNDVQAAYDVLGNPALKASYDAGLARHNNKVDLDRSSFHHSSSSTAHNASSVSRRNPTVKLTTPREKAAMRARASQSLESLRQRRSERDAEDARLDVAGLKESVEIWQDSTLR